MDKERPACDVFGEMLRFFGGDDRTLYRSNSDLDRLATRFIRRSYLEELSSLQRAQDIPVDAFITQPASPVFISYPWLGHNRPNDGILERIRTFVPNRKNIGVWIDYCCLPQARRDGMDDRLDAERAFFKRQLQYIPTIILKSQMVVLWSERQSDRAWCVVELLIADIMKNVIMKQIYNNRAGLSDAILFYVHTYEPEVLCITGDVEGTPVAKILLPHSIKDLPMSFYNSVLTDLSLPPTPLTDLLRRVKQRHVDHFFADRGLSCGNPHDVPLLKQLLFNVCQFAGSYDVRSVKWSGKISWRALWPFLMSNLADFTVELIDYDFN